MCITLREDKSRKRAVKEKEENRSEKNREERENKFFLLSLLFFKQIHSTSIVMVISMNRQLFSEVFKQISSKIDQLKAFLPSTAHLKVTEI